MDKCKGKNSEGTNAAWPHLASYRCGQCEAASPETDMETMQAKLTHEKSLEEHCYVPLDRCRIRAVNADSVLGQTCPSGTERAGGKCSVVAPGKKKTVLDKESTACRRGTWSCNARFALKPSDPCGSDGRPTIFPILNTSECWFPARSPLALKLANPAQVEEAAEITVQEQCLQPPLVFFAKAPPAQPQFARPSIPENYLCDANDGGDPKYFYHAATAATAAVNAIVDWDEKAQCSRPQLLLLAPPAPSHMRHSVGAGVQRRFPL